MVPVRRCAPLRLALRAVQRHGLEGLVRVCALPLRLASWQALSHPLPLRLALRRV